MGRRSFSREFKLEAVRLVSERGLTVTQAARDLDIHETVLRHQKLLADHGIECSMSRLGECHDNAVMESFFSRMKEERLNRRRYRTRNEARAEVFDYIERFYNPKRRHSTLGGISPVEFEKRAN